MGNIPRNILVLRVANKSMMLRGTSRLAPAVVGQCTVPDNARGNTGRGTRNPPAYGQEEVESYSLLEKGDQEYLYWGGIMC
jgi:hypothetical protein